MSLSVFLHYARLRMRERMEYRGAFIIGMFSQLIGYAAGYAVLWLTLQRFETIGSWNWPEIAFLYSLNILTYAIGAAFAYSPMIELEKLVRQGTFDPILIRPRNPYLTLVAQMINVGYIPHIFLSASVLVWSFTQLDVAWTWTNALFIALAIVSGSLLQAALLTFIGAWSLIIVRADVLFRFYYSLSEFVNYPISIFSAGIQILLSTIVSMAFVNFYPAAILLNKGTGVMPEWIAWFTPIVGPVLMWLSYRTFNACVNRYQDAGG